ncbi:Lox4p [Orobanche gracilis]
MLQGMVESFITGRGDDQEGGHRKIKGKVVLMKKNVLDFNDLSASVLDTVHELVGQKVSLQLISSVNTDSENKGKGKVGRAAYLEKWITTMTSSVTVAAGDTTFDVNFDWEEDMGIPGAFIINNFHHSEFYLKTLTLEHVPNHGRLHFVCNSWVYPAHRYTTQRVFFTNKSYLPSETPGPLVPYREEELAKLRGGDASGQVKEWDRVYDYAYYNDLGDPDKGEDYARPVLGGSSVYPYPRRGRTGRPPTNTDPNSEKRVPLLMSLNIYVPRDERFGHLKMSDFLGYGLKSIFQFLLPEFKDLCDSISNEFDSFENAIEIYEGGLKLPDGPLLKSIYDNIPLELLKQLLPTDGEGLFRFPVPKVIQEDKSAWRTDEEFTREMLAGVNPVIISRLQEFPPRSNLDPNFYGSQNCTITWNHIRNQLDGLTIDEVRTHWLRTHAVIEPFVIATNRQLSVLHPIHKLLHPHFRNTMNINAIARQILINAGGILESTVFPAKYAMELSSIIYRDWVFTDQALPVDLLKRGMAVEDANSRHGLRLLIEDYPYAVDGLEIWSAIQTWVDDYCNLYYASDDKVKEDTELQSWWNELRDKGHEDKKNEPWWPKMHTRRELIDSCTIIIWLASALHAAVNFGQYPYAGYMPNRPTVSRRFMPEPGSQEYDDLRTNPDKVYLRTITARLQTLLGIALIEILSRHSSDEVYLGQRETTEWTADRQALEAFDKFGKKLSEIEEGITKMNNDEKWKNRIGPVKLPYTLLYPTSEDGLTGKGIPNSVSI